ncbi:hypothetical protein Q4Q34_15000 [Flavivirga abyssicola]|uniref:hypothetical protein n=1 Tax=Flavivirga abyssicola TaxID=3063533 RepID=UPI0026DEF9FC|nr:hypothetical protein [Flavivirga sp. MEBiC07777]WVK12526.1 hypothetical protein Q4Q34_15000 [Flavivirga sp. MEBiC07777]
MRKLFLVSISLFLLAIYSCDDGDVITVELEFGETFEACEGVSSLILYKTKNDPSESLSLRVNALTFDELLDVDEVTKTYTKEVTINSSNPFNYRTYSNATLPSNLFCNDIPLSDIIITQDIESTSGTAVIETVLTEDDNDGIPAEFEDINGNGNLEDDDTDNDSIPNYIDPDDDGDNILTKDENVDPNNDGIFSDAQDTDGNGTPDYLDDDDDGDGVKTRDEENDSDDLNPANDITIGTTPDYLNPDVSTSVVAIAYRDHNITQTFTVSLTISNFDLTLISLDIFDFGILQDSRLTKTRKGEPVFN